MQVLEQVAPRDSDARAPVEAQSESAILAM